MRYRKCLASIELLIAIAVSSASTALAGGVDKIELRDLKPLDVRGKLFALGGNPKQLGGVYVFVSHECPISRQYVPELNRLAAATDAARLPFFGVISDATLTRQAAVKFVDEFALKFPVLFDGSAELARLFQPDVVPEAFIVDKQGAVIYRGRIDDLYADVGKRRTEPSQRDLEVAIKAVLDGKPVAEARTKAVGCPFEAPAEKSDKPTITYARDVAPILFAHCTECHRPGEVAPFSLLTFQDASKRAANISRVVARKLMPPWRAEAGYGHFLDERRLTPAQIALLEEWHKQGAPEGNVADLPPTPKYPSGWKLGEPDRVVEVPVEFEVPADGPDIFQHFVMPIDLPKDEMLVGFEFRPGNPAVVHHAIVLLDSSGRARLRNAETPEPGWKTSGSIDVGMTAMVGVWTPGMTPRILANDVGIPLDKGSDAVVQLHLHPSGKKEKDRSKVAFYFAKKPVKKVMSRNPVLLGTLVIEIPPGEARYRTGSKIKLPVDITLTSTFPHMHYIGKEMKVTATLPDGKKQPIIWIKDWNFFWQDSYVYAEPIRLPKGTTLEVEAYYDNSAENPANPSKPPKTVTFGNDTTDEMCFVLLQAVPDQPGLARNLGAAMMRSFMEEWNTAPLTPEARTKIMAEAMKLFGGRGRGRRPAPQPAPKPST